MIGTAHPVAPEEIMALVDGELSAEERQSIAEHLEQCAECSALRDEFLGTSKALAQWTVPDAPASLDRAMEAKTADGLRVRRAKEPLAHPPLSFRNRHFWAIGSGGMVAGALFLVAVIAVFVERPAQFEHKTRHVQVAEQRLTGYFAPSQAAPAASSAVAEIAGVVMDNHSVAQTPYRIDGGSAPGPPPPPAQVALAPMIARSVSLTVRVKDIAASRTALDGILAEHHGYAASLTINTPEDGPRSFQSSLRIPAPELHAGLDALRKLGRLETETQSGEEVTQQHADLIARLTNARETEERLRQLLAERTGKMEDVLDVEEKISETRGQIESMEAEQATLEHRVAFATVDLQLVEEYKEQLATGASVSVGMRLRNALVAGMRNAGESLLGLILLLEEYGPVILIWIVILGGPAAILWHRYRRIRGQS